MAIGRLCMKVGKAGKASPHAAYIAREGQYASRVETGEKLSATEAGNMPAWAQANPSAFWLAADAYERQNGTTYREMELALPRELSTDERILLVREFVRQEIGERHAYQWAIHVPLAADGKEQPHAHLMFSERQVDSIERDPEQYFKRYNGKAPEKGGARKGYGPSAGQTLAKVERAAELKALRNRWQDLTNTHLERAGQDARIDMRSYADQGVDLRAERKQRPSDWRGQGKAEVIEFRQARAELASAKAALRQAIPDTGAEVINLQVERQRREQEKRDAQEQALKAHAEQQAQTEKERIERLSAAELADEIEALRPRSVHDLIRHDLDVIKTEQRRQELTERHQKAEARETWAHAATEGWRADHPILAKAHDAGLKQSGFLIEQAQIKDAAHHEWLLTGPRLVEAEQAAQYAKIHATSRIHREQSPTLTRIAELETVLAAKRAQEQNALREEAQRKTLAREFEGMAAKRAMQASGYRDTSEEWKATPLKLRDLIDAYNQQPKAVQEVIVTRMVSNPITAQHLVELMKEQKENLRQLDRGHSHGL